MLARRKLGRPIGSRTFLETPAVKRARQYLALRLSLMKPTDAAKIVAAEWQVSESTVFHDYKRHRSRLRADNHIWHGRRLMQYHPNVADAFARRLATEFRSGFDKLAARLDSLGDTVGAQAARAFDPERAIESDAWLAVLGQLYVDLLERRSRKRTFR